MNHDDGHDGKPPYLLLLACPMMHFFGHRGHGHGGHGDESTGNKDSGSGTRQTHQPPTED